MAKRHEEAAKRQSLAEKARFAWTQERIANIHQHISAYDVLRRHGVELQHGDNQEEQFSCPFHGVDRRPSARVYPVSARSPSHAWCFVCQERWDAISLWRKFNPSEDLSFSQALGAMERAYGLESPVLSEDAHLAAPKDLGELQGFDDLFGVAERRLQKALGAFKYLNDMNGYLRAGSVLDKLRYRIDERQLTPVRGMVILRQLLDRIAEKVRQCPEG